MPLLGHVETNESDSFAFSDLRIPETIVPITGAAGGAQFGPFPIIPDFTQEQATVTNDLAASLHDRVTGNAWLLQRIVGKLHLNITSATLDSGTTDSSVWKSVFLKFGLFVARTEDFDQNSADLFADEASPCHVDNAMDPWIFQRSWILGNPLHNAVANTFEPRRVLWPTNTSAVEGGLHCGSHIDTKSKRLISREHRLFGILEGRGWDPAILEMAPGTESAQPSFSGILDLRVYGSLRNSKPGSSF